MVQCVVCWWTSLFVAIVWAADVKHARYVQASQSLESERCLERATGLLFTLASSCSKAAWHILSCFMEHPVCCAQHVKTLRVSGLFNWLSRDFNLLTVNVLGASCKIKCNWSEKSDQLIWKREREKKNQIENTRQWPLTEKMKFYIANWDHGSSSFFQRDIMLIIHHSLGESGHVSGWKTREKDACAEVRNVEEEQEHQQQPEVWEVRTRALFLCMLQLQPSPRLFVWAWAQGMSGSWTLRARGWKLQGSADFPNRCLTAAKESRKTRGGFDDRNNKSSAVLIQQA